MTELQQIASSLCTSSARYDAIATRRQLLKLGFESGVLIPFAYRPFDTRTIYWHGQTKLLDEKRQELAAWRAPGNLFLTSRQKGERDDEGSPFYLTPLLPDWHLTRPGSTCFPLRHRSEEPLDEGLFAHAIRPQEEWKPNLAGNALDFVHGFSGASSDSPWFHAVAIGHSPKYLRENAAALRQDFPRIPLPDDAQRLKASSALGQQLTILLDPETPAPGVSQGTIRAEFKLIGPIARMDGKGISAKAGDLELTVGWGHGGKGGVTMPGRGKVIERAYTKEERAALNQAEVGKQAWPALLGETTCDVFLNTKACWTNIPIKVWGYTVGGYQVIKKWLSYREHELLGRALSVEEARYVTEMSRRIAAILLLGPALDENYDAVKVDTWEWPAA